MFHKKEGSQIIPTDIPAGKFTAAQLASRHAARENEHNDLLAGQQSDPLGHQPVDSRSNHESPAGRAGKIPADNPILTMPADQGNGHTIQYEPSYGGPVSDFVKTVQANSRTSPNEK